MDANELLKHIKRTCGSFTTTDVVDTFGCSIQSARAALRTLVNSGEVDLTVTGQANLYRAAVKAENLVKPAAPPKFVPMVDYKLSAQGTRPDSDSRIYPSRYV